MKHSPFISPACKGNPMKFTNEVLLLSLFPLFLLGCSPRGTTENKIILSGDILDSEGHYDVHMFKNLGWKASKEFPKDSLPRVTNIWYGFFKQKDIELRFYSSHSDLKNYGIKEAELTVSMGKPEWHQGGIDKTRLSYGAYLIAGNVIIMCEADVDDCLELVHLLIH